MKEGHFWDDLFFFLVFFGGRNGWDLGRKRGILIQSTLFRAFEVIICGVKFFFWTERERERDFFLTYFLHSRKQALEVRVKPFCFVRPGGLT